MSRTLAFSSGLEASDPRDKFYALMGVAALEVNLQGDCARPMPLIYADNVSKLFKMAPPSVKPPFESKNSHAFWNMDFRSAFRGIHVQPLKSAVTTRGRAWKDEFAGSNSMWDMKLPMSVPNPGFPKTATPEDKMANWSEDDSTMSTISTLPPASKKGLGYTSLVHSLTRSALTRRKNWLVVRVCVQLGPIISQCASNGESYQHDQLPSSKGGFPGNEEKSTHSQTAKNRGTKRDRDEHSDDEEDQGHPRKKNKRSNASALKNLLACPFHQRDPHGPSTQGSCNGPGWASVSRVK